ncbi:MAG TPA: SMP-30/gluconolactonase/LRE family protein [Thermoanaerobaculia bacterium]
MNAGRLRTRFFALALALVIPFAGAPVQSAWANDTHPWIFTDLAGSAGGPGDFDGKGDAARFNQPTGLAIDASGNVYIADQWNHTIRKISPTGAVTTLAGLSGHVGGADGARWAARFSYPAGIASDSSGNLYVADTANHTIRKITTSGAVTTVAGLAGFWGITDGTGSAARFNGPRGLALDAGGNLYVADRDNHTIRRITPEGVVTTVAGVAGSIGSSDGTGSEARFLGPSDVAVDQSGNVYVADSSNHTIRKITQDGTVTTFAGLAGHFSSIDGAGSAARFWMPSGLSIDASGDLYVSEFSTIRKVTPGGVVTTLAGTHAALGSADGTGGAARFRSPAGSASDSSGNLYIADRENHVIRRITPAVQVSTLAGRAGNWGDVDGIGSAARFSSPAGVTSDGAGNAYVADTANHKIRKITASGIVTTVAGSGTGSSDGPGSNASFYRPEDVASDASGNLFVADTNNHTIRKITPAGEVTTLAGLTETPGSDDGPGTSARFHYPARVASDTSGNLYVADGWNHTIRKITPEGVVTTLAGLAGMRGSSDGVGSAARFDFPVGLTTDASGNLFVADQYNHAIRRITPGGFVTTWVGSADGSVFRFPSGIAADLTGNLYVADTGNRRIRMITPVGDVTTIGGELLNGGSAEGTGSAARFGYPTDIAVNENGTLIVADQFNHKIRIGRRAIADTAMTYGPTGNVAVVRQLDVVPQTATSWEWSIIRRPAGSAAELSSTSVRNPLFVPDVADLYQFRVVASGPDGSSITSVFLQATEDGILRAPLNVNAIGTGSNTVAVFWSAGSAAVTYQLYRSPDGTTWTPIGTPTASLSTTDNSVSANTAYLYRIRSRDGDGNESADSPRDLATTVVFTDPDLVPGVTPIKAVHITQLRTATNAVRSLAGLPVATFTDPVLGPAVPVKRIHLIELRTALEQGRTALSLATKSFDDPAIAAGTTPIRAIHLIDLRGEIQ